MCAVFMFSTKKGIFNSLVYLPRVCRGLPAWIVSLPNGGKVTEEENSSQE